MGRQLEVSLWMENKGMPPPSKSLQILKKEGVLALHTWGCGPHICTFKSNHHSLVKTHRGQCIQPSASRQP